MAWIESHQETGAHPKTKKLARLLECDVPSALGHLHLLWHWTMSYADDGNLSKFEAADISDGCMWNGEPERFVEHLVDAGWIDRAGETLTVHDWSEYGGKLAEKRRKDRERKAAARHTDDDRKSAGSPQDILGTAHVEDQDQIRGPREEDQDQRTGAADPRPSDNPKTQTNPLVARAVACCQVKTATSQAQAEQIIAHGLSRMVETEVERIVRWLEGQNPRTPVMMWEPLKKRAMEIGAKSLPEKWTSPVTPPKSTTLGALPLKRDRARDPENPNAEARR